MLPWDWYHRWRVYRLRARRPSIQLHTNEIFTIYRAIRCHPECRLLVFGTGHDTPLWVELNPRGRTAFLEDNHDWIEHARRACPGVEVHPVTYRTVLSEWPQVQKDLAAAELELPGEVSGTPWDVILVDAPSGDLRSFWREHHREPPGRASSIQAAAHLVRPGGDIFIHDCERESEDALSRVFFQNRELVGEVRGRALLRHYRG
jgi:hypothetical protein